MVFLCFRYPSGVVWQSRDLQLSRNTLYRLSPRLCFFVSSRDLFLTVVHWRVQGYHANRTTNKMFCTTSETEGNVGTVKLV